MNLVFNRLLIFDGSHALHRSLSEPHLWEMKNSSGQRTGGVYGTLQTILKESSTYNYFPVVVFDGHLSQRRLEVFPNYKRIQDKQLLLESNEPLTEEQQMEMEHRREYNTQREILKELLPAFGIPVIHLSEWEGDDIIYILTRMCKDSIVVSDDKDLIQLVTHTPERRCRVRRGMRDEFVDTNYLQEHNIDIDNFVACKAIVGDSSDNIPSACFKVGEKTAPDLYKLYQISLVTVGGYPQDEKQLEEKCKLAGVNKRKAYLNFDENQFLKNVLLMDLRLVDKDITDNVIQNIQNQILSTYNIINGDLILEILKELDIKSFIINNLLDNVRITSEYVTLDSLNKYPNIPDIRTKKIGGLF